MAALLPVAVYGLKVPAGDVMIPALADFPATFRITMAAIDPSAEPEEAGTTSLPNKPRATLKMVYDPSGPDDDDESEDESEDTPREFLKKLLASRDANGKEDQDDEDEDDDDEADEEESSDDEEEKNGGPSDPSKTKKARKQAALEQILASMDGDENEDEDEMDVDASPKVNGDAKTMNKGKGKAIEVDIEGGVEDGEDNLDELGMEEVVICTLDPEKNYQQTLDITIPEDQNAYFKVSGTHTVYLTGNYVIPAENGERQQSDLIDDEDSEEDYDLEPDEDELDEDASDELDDLEDPRITEVDSDDENEIPELVKKGESIKKTEPAKKGSNKRPAEDSEDEPANLDEIMSKSLKPESTEPEPKLSKKQLKKLKKNNGKPTEATSQETKDTKASDKKVQFATNLEAPPSNSQPKTNGNTMAAKSSPGIKMVQGVKIDDKKIGKGPVAKNGNTVEMRYIGKLHDGKVFDANKAGKPFSFKIGKGEVIKGWDIGVAGMSPGGERRIIVPANLAYGKKSLPGIPSNSDLTFDLKLLAVK